MTTPLWKLSDAELQNTVDTKQGTKEANAAYFLLARRRGIDKLINDAKFRANGAAKVHTSAVAGQMTPFCDGLDKKADEAKEAALNDNANKIVSTANANPSLRSSLGSSGAGPGPTEAQMLQLSQEKNDFQQRAPSSFLSQDDQIRYQRCVKARRKVDKAETDQQIANHGRGPGHDNGIINSTKNLAAANNELNNVGNQPVTNYDRVLQTVKGPSEAASMAPVEGVSQVGSAVHGVASALTGDFDEVPMDVVGAVGGGPVTDTLRGVRAGAKDLSAERRIQEAASATRHDAAEDASVAQREHPSDKDASRKCKCAE